MGEFIKIDHLRPGTELPRTKVCLVYNGGGIGDYIYWTRAIQYVIDHHPHIYGYILCPPYFIDLARLWLGHYRDRFRIIETAQWETEKVAQGTPCIVPNRAQYANATGFSLHQLGFVYYAQIDFIPRGYESPPHILGDECSVERFALPEGYVVVTPYATHENRRLRASAVNELTEYLRRNDITPVFLGKSHMAIDHEANVDDGINLAGVIGLHEKTSLREAAVIMSRARAVIGLDNGLLHLAACSKVPLVFGLTTVEPRLRVPVRRYGARTTTVTPPAELKCRFCTRERYIIGHDFKNCLYRDNLCTELITGSDLIRAFKELNT